MFRFLVNLIEDILNKSHNDDVPRADMFLPFFVCALGGILIIFAIAALVYYFIFFGVWSIIIAILFGGLGACAIACWKNQTIEIISDEEFVYTTFLGNAYTLRFDDMVAFRQNADSITLFFTDRKVHIESKAVLSDRLVELLNKQLERFD